MKSLLASELPVPSNVTVVLSATFCGKPALATGAELAADAVMVTTEAVLSTMPSFTVRMTE